MIQFRNFLSNSTFREIERGLTTAPGRVPSVLVVSIGNPEPQYSGTRHCVAHSVLRKIAKDLNLDAVKPKECTKYDGTVFAPNSALANALLFISDRTFMNLQGRPIRNAWEAFRKGRDTENLRLVVIHDELQIPFGKVQLRKSGTSARGHNGLRSIDSTIGQTYIKIGIGISKPQSGSVSDYVMSKFTQKELDVLHDLTIENVYHTLEKISNNSALN